MTLRHYKKQLYATTLFFIFVVLLCVIQCIQIAKIPLIPKHRLPVIITLNKAATARQFVKTLREKKLISAYLPLLSVIRMTGLSSQLKAGVYPIKPGETALQILHRVVAGEVLTQNVIIIAGSTQLKITQVLQQLDYFNYRAQDWNLIQGSHPNAEGLLLADTYQYQAQSTSQSVLEQAHRNLIEYLQRCWASKDPNLPYKNPYELLIAASIIEKETAVPQERQLISGVLINRLNKKMPLQMDPTVIYALGTAYTGKLSHNDMQIDSAYNSYHHRGLPPTPIAMVGKEALDAAAHPEQTHYLYFVAKGDGTHQFSTTYEQQKQAIRRIVHGVR